MRSGQFRHAHDLLEWLDQGRRDGVTGSLLVMTQQRMVLRVGIREGRIVRLTCGQGSGRRALPAMARIGAAVFRFLDDVITERVDELPETATLLADLRRLIAPRAVAASGLIPVAAAQSMGEGDALPLASIAALLAEYVGPAAQWICEELFDPSGDLEHNLREIARQCLSHEQQGDFLARALQLVGQH